MSKSKEINNTIDFLEKAKLYKRIEKEMGVLRSEKIIISPLKMKEISEEYHTRVKLSYYKGVDRQYNYYFNLCIDGVKFTALADEAEVDELNICKGAFERGERIWG